MIMNTNAAETTMTETTTSNAKAAKAAKSGASKVQEQAQPANIEATSNEPIATDSTDSTDSNATGQQEATQKSKLDVKVKPASKNDPGITINGSSVNNILGAYPKNLKVKFRVEGIGETDWIQFHGSRERLDLQNNPTGIYSAYYSGTEAHPFDIAKLMQTRGVNAKVIGFEILE